MPRCVSSLPFHVIFMYNVYIMGTCILMGDDIYSGMYVCGCTCICLCARVGVACIYVYMCVQLCVTAFQTRSCDPNSVTGDPDSCRCRPDTQAIQRQIHGMTSRSVPVRTVKTR